MNKASIANRLTRVGLRDVAEAYREEVRIRRKRGNQGREDRDVASLAAWEEMWDTFRQTVERSEARLVRMEANLKCVEELKLELSAVTGELVVAKRELASAAVESPASLCLAGLPADLDKVLDTGYKEQDVSRQLRDGLLWSVMEFSRVVEDTANGPVAHIDRASNLAPNPFALLILTTYALSTVDRRRELIARALGFASKADGGVGGGGVGDGGDGGYLDGI